MRKIHVILAIPGMLLGGGYLYLQWKVNRYPPSARKLLRKAMLAHDQGSGNTALVQNQYLMVIIYSFQQE